jgi:death-on-curing protein
LARPYSGYYRSVEKKAAALVESFAKNHGFLDGNKRTTLLLLHVFLDKSGYELRPCVEGQLNEETEDMIMSVVNNALKFDDLVTWFRMRIFRPL